MSDTEQAPNTEQETPQASQAQATSQGSQPETSQGSNEGQTPEPKFTQDDLDRIATRIRKEARDSAKSEFVSELGVESFEELQSLFTEAKKRKEAEMSELEKAQLEIDKAKKQAQEALEAKQTLEKQILESGRKQAFLKAVQDSGGNQADHLFILVQATKAEDFATVFGEGASPDDAKMKAFIKGIQSDFPSYFGTAGAGSPSNANGVSPKGADFTEEAANQWLNKLRS